MAKELSCSVSFMRGLLLLLNIIFVLVGIALIGIGIYIKVDDSFSTVLNEFAKVSSFESQSLGYLAFVLIGGGIFTLFIALFGCAGTLWHNRCLLYMYAIILIILMILEFVGFIMAFVYKSKLEDVYRTSLKDAFIKALDDNNEKVLKVFHKMENSLKCCGANGPSDYSAHGKEPSAECFQHPKGCSDTIIDFLKKSLPIIGGTLGGVLLLELISLIIAIVLAVALKNASEDTFSSNPGEVLSYVVPGRRRNYERHP